MLLFLGCALAHASTFAPVDLDTLMASTDAVVRGQGRDLVVRVDPQTGLVTTDATLYVAHGVLGPHHDGDVIVVREVGGATDDLVMTAPGFPKLQLGADVVVFLTAWPDGTPRISEYGAGFYAVVPGPDGAVLIPGPLQDSGGASQGATPPVPAGTPVRALLPLLTAIGE
jgi:hypothetical protein